MLHEYLRDTLELSYSDCKSCRGISQTKDVREGVQDQGTVRRFERTVPVGGPREADAGPLGGLCINVPVSDVESGIARGRR